MSFLLFLGIVEGKVYFPLFFHCKSLQINGIKHKEFSLFNSFFNPRKQYLTLMEFRY